MKKKIFSVALMYALTLSLSSGYADAATNKVMWGNAELKNGQIGRVTMLETGFSIFKLENGKMVPARYVKKGEVFRVYGKRKGDIASCYSLGANLYAYYESHRLDGSHSYLQKNLKYETPSKSKFALVNGK